MCTPARTQARAHTHTYTSDWLTDRQTERLTDGRANADGQCSSCVYLLHPFASGVCHINFSFTQRTKQHTNIHPLRIGTGQCVDYTSKEGWKVANISPQRGNLFVILDFVKDNLRFNKDILKPLTTCETASGAESPSRPGNDKWKG